MDIEPWQESLLQRFTGYAQERFAGDRTKAVAYLSRARLFLGALRHQLALAGIDHGVRDVRLLDGTHIRVMFDGVTNYIDIECPPVEHDLKEALIVCVNGFIVFPDNSEWNQTTGYPNRWKEAMVEKLILFNDKKRQYQVKDEYQQPDDYTDAGNITWIGNKTFYEHGIPLSWGLGQEKCLVLSWYGPPAYFSGHVDTTVMTDRFAYPPATIQVNQGDGTTFIGDMQVGFTSGSSSPFSDPALASGYNDVSKSVYWGHVFRDGKSIYDLWTIPAANNPITGAALALQNALDNSGNKIHLLYAVSGAANTIFYRVPISPDGSFSKTGAARQQIFSIQHPRASGNSYWEANIDRKQAVFGFSVPGSMRNRSPVHFNSTGTEAVCIRFELCGPDDWVGAYDQTDGPQVYLDYPYDLPYLYHFYFDASGGVTYTKELATKLITYNAYVAADSISGGSWQVIFDGGTYKNIQQTVTVNQDYGWSGEVETTVAVEFDRNDNVVTAYTRSSQSHATTFFVTGTNLEQSSSPPYPSPGWETGTRTWLSTNCGSKNHTVAFHAEETLYFSNGLEPLKMMQVDYRSTASGAEFNTSTVVSGEYIARSLNYLNLRDRVVAFSEDKIHPYSISVSPSRFSTGVPLSESELVQPGGIAYRDVIQFNGNEVFSSPPRSASILRPVFGSGASNNGAPITKSPILSNGRHPSTWFRYYRYFFLPYCNYPVGCICPSADGESLFISVPVEPRKRFNLFDKQRLFYGYGVPDGATSFLNATNKGWNMYDGTDFYGPPPHNIANRVIGLANYPYDPANPLQSGCAAILAPEGAGDWWSAPAFYTALVGKFGKSSTRLFDELGLPGSLARLYPIRAV